nr:unnamed protein product [Naegleria fowleri]
MNSSSPPSLQILNLSSLPLEMMIEIAKYLPLRLVLSDSFLIPLKYVLGMDVYSIEMERSKIHQDVDSTMGQTHEWTRQHLPLNNNREVEIYWRQFLSHHVRKQFQSLDPRSLGPIALLSRIFKYTSKCTIQKFPFYFRNGCIETEICNILCIPDEFKFIFMDKLKIIPKYSIEERGKPQQSKGEKNKERAIAEFENKSWSITELQFLLGFVERNSFIFILKNEIIGKKHPNLSKTLKDDIDVELVYCNRSLTHHEYCELSMYLSNKFNFDKPMRIRGSATMKDGAFELKNIRYTPLETQPMIKNLSDTWYSIFSKFVRCCSNSAQERLCHEILLQHFWYPGTEIEITTSKTGYMKSDVVNSVSLYLNDTPEIVKTIDSLVRFDTADSVEKVIVSFNPRTSKKTCQIFPQKIPFSVLHISMIVAITYFALANSCLLNWKYSRQFYNSNHFSFKGILLFSILDVFSFAGYPFKALLSYLWGCFKEQHVTFIESVCNLGFARYLIWTIVSTFKSYYRYHEVEIPLTSTLPDKSNTKLSKTD